ncbi:hypothetical protein ES703_56826 [subsurface metagenome]
MPEKVIVVAVIVPLMSIWSLTTMVPGSKSNVSSSVRVAVKLPNKSVAVPVKLPVMVPVSAGSGVALETVVNDPEAMAKLPLSTGSALLTTTYVSLLSAQSGAQPTE